MKPTIQPNGFKMNDGLCGAGGMTLAAFLGGFLIGAALNHNQLAIDTHGVNFPTTRHYVADVRGGRWPGLMGFCDWLHMSPDCRHHSRAKGGKPVSKSVRALAVEVPRYAWASHAKIITIENVPEFVEWGPEEHVLGEDGQPLYVLNTATGEQEPVMRAIASRKGEYYAAWKATLRAMGYVNQESWFMNSADYGSAQARRRYIGVFTRAGIPITAPTKTHDEFGRGGLPKWRGAIELLEPGNYGESVFTRAKPYVEATLNRMAEGVERYGESAAPWMLKYVSNPPSGKPNPGYSTWKPLHTITCQRTPLVVRPVLLHPYYKSGRCTPAWRPLQTLPCKDRFAVMSAVMPVPGFSFSHQFGNGPKGIKQPLRTLLASRRHQYLCFFHYYSGGGQLSKLGSSLPCILSNGHARLLTAQYAPQTVPGFTFVNQFRNPAVHAKRPLSTMLASKRPHQICFFHYLGSHGNQVSSLLRPLLTLPTNPQHRLLSGIYAEGRPGEKVVDQPGDSPATLRLKAACRKAGMVDLLARQLTVRESARGQGFPDWYEFLGSETDKRKMIGNAVEVNTGLAVAREVQQMLSRFAASSRKLPKLKKAEMMVWEQSELFGKEVLAA